MEKKWNTKRKKTFLKKVVTYFRKYFHNKLLQQQEYECIKVEDRTEDEDE